MLRSVLMVAGGGLLLLTLFALFNRKEIDPAELARRCAENYPAWNGYQEDVKEIGARPVAQWHGHPSRLSFSAAGVVHLVFVLEPPWNAWSAALPVLLKTPEGQVFRNEGFVRDGTTCRYTFLLPSGSGTPRPPWLEIQYPHTKRRLYLDAQGVWNGEKPGDVEVTDRSFSHEQGQTLGALTGAIQTEE